MRPQQLSQRALAGTGERSLHCLSLLQGPEQQEEQQELVPAPGTGVTLPGARSQPLLGDLQTAEAQHTEERDLPWRATHGRDAALALLLHKLFSVAAPTSPRKKTHLYRGAGRIREPVLPPLLLPLHGQGGVAHPVHLEHLGTKGGKGWEPPLLSTAHPQQAPEEKRLLWKRNNMYPWG